METQSGWRLRAAIAVTVLVAATISASLAHDLFRMPLQYSDNADTITLAHQQSSSALFTRALTISSTTLRPMVFVQTRWLIRTAQAFHWSDTDVFRFAGAALAVVLVASFMLALRIASVADCAAATLAVVVLVGHHATEATWLASYPISHYAEITVAVVGILAIASRPPRLAGQIAAIAMLLFGLLLFESGILIAVAIVACAIVRLPGCSRRTAAIAIGLVAVYAVVRLSLDIQAPGLGGHGSGYGTRFHSSDELSRIAGIERVLFMAYNVAGGFLSILLSEPRSGLYESLAIARGASPTPAFLINVGSSAVVTGLIVSYLMRLPPWATMTDRHRLVIVACVLILATAALNLAYIKDEILSVGAAAYAVAAFAAFADLLLRPRRALGTVAVAVLVLATGGLLSFRAAGVPFHIREVAFKNRHDWARVTLEGIPEPTLAVKKRLFSETIVRRTTAREFLPHDGEQYWGER